jgi:hypothetical protein
MASPHSEPSVHNWRASQLKRLGISGTLAEIYADCVDWHQIARLVQHGCPPAAHPAHRRLTSAARIQRDDRTRELA